MNSIRFVFSCKKIATLFSQSLPPNGLLRRLLVTNSSKSFRNVINSRYLQLGVLSLSLGGMLATRVPTISPSSPTPPEPHSSRTSVAFFQWNSKTEVSSPRTQRIDPDQISTPTPTVLVDPRKHHWSPCAYPVNYCPEVVLINGKMDGEWLVRDYFYIYVYIFSSFAEEKISHEVTEAVPRRLTGDRHKLIF